jgi:hypothetical protein
MLDCDWSSDVCSSDLNLVQNLDELYDKVRHSDLPKIWLPDRRCVFSIPEWPVLGSGKVDLAKGRALARQLAGGSTK